MILVHLSKSRPDVIAGRRTAAEVTLGEWAAISDGALDEHGDVILGIHQNEVVTAFDVTGWTRKAPGGRVTFTGEPCRTWVRLVGDANPGRAWVRGQARPVQYFGTGTLSEDG